MARNHTVKFMATREEKERVRMIALANGFSRPSIFLRHITFNHNYTIEQKIIQTHAKVCEIKELLEEFESLGMRTKKRVEKLHNSDLSKYDWIDELYDEIKKIKKTSQN